MEKTIEKGSIKLYKSIKNSDGEDMNKVNYDFENLPSNAIATSTQFLMERNYPVMNPGNDIELHNLMTCAAAGIDKADGFRLHPKDKMRLAAASVLFFTEDSDDSQQGNTSEN